MKYCSISSDLTVHRESLVPFPAKAWLTVRNREVRRAALYNLPRTPATVPHILARTRDSDATLRRIVYLGPLSTQALPDPRVLSIAQREEVVKNGLGDREPAVRRAAAFMLGEWLTAAGGDLLEVSRTKEYRTFTDAGL